MTDVTIVGAGPVGLLTALGLGRAGFDVEVIDAAPGVNTAPRAMSYTWAVFADLEKLGVLDDLLAAGLRDDARSWRVRRTGETIVFDFSALRPYTDRAYGLTLGQDRLSDVVLGHIARIDNITIRWSTAFTGLRQTPEAIVVSAESPEGPVEIVAPWLIGCDGGRSAVRKSLDLPFAGITFPHRFVATNIHYDFDSHGWLSGYLIDPEFGAIVAKIAGDDLWRVTFAEDASLPHEGMEKRITRFIEEILPGSKDFDLAAWTPYNMHQRTAPTYRVGRVLLAGDAAHVTNPTSGLGLMGGMLDGFALCEALVAVLSGRADDTILDRYSDARRAVFTQQTSPISVRSMNLVFHSHDETELERSLAWGRRLMADPDAMGQYLAAAITLRTPSLV
ncbi:NAD(P)/FAD-dependent oxidoreductase [Sphingomonas naphthae]|uniref:NAD(P)/FAD-dependent oxidoreductase n=1 Tax=Sphingomonas naphthae TaxID=1813468 RepID=A0ABY7TIE5_9SPHN|nr:NAD(P)/FAD-dependent oxidoreductase [Sphingomonas naphthae]WCT72205.1 NAD(P)/FAD-dependent oxidoreductase [Sphingomonas naphthae]